MSTSSYKQSGVDIDAGNALVDNIKQLTKNTKTKDVISGIGGFAGLFSLNHSQVKDPVLVACTDGIGTKVKLATDINQVSGLGQDLVAMCVNDLICCGAKPLFFLDYFATGKLDVELTTEVIASVANTLKDIQCALLGGETAEMPGMYQSGDFDMAGFSVGIVDRDQIIDGSHISLGNKIIGIESSGFHSNGYSLLRHVIKEKKIDLSQKPSFADESLGDLLIKPTTIYVNPILSIIRNFSIHAMSHITGGGIVENLPRVLPKQCQAKIAKDSIPVPELYRYIQEAGNIEEDEMWRVFNMGIGFALIVSPDDADAITQQLSNMDYKAHVIGEVAGKSNDDDQSIVFT
jgi:phosphoribosylformylglycinamidine cyclo-ligase